MIHTKWIIFLRRSGRQEEEERQRKEERKAEEKKKELERNVRNRKRKTDRFDTIKVKYTLFMIPLVL